MRIGARAGVGRTLTVAGAVAFAAASFPAFDAAGQEPVQYRVRALPASAGWLGLTVLEEVAFERGRAASTSVTVSRVVDGGPSDAAGLRPGDRVLQVNGREAHPAVFNAVASGLGPGGRMRVQVERPGGERLELVVTAAPRPADATVRVPGEMGERISSKLRELDSLRLVLERRAPGGVTVFRRDTAAAGVSGTIMLPSRDEPVGPLHAWVEGQNWIAGGRFTELNVDLAAYFETASGLLVTEILPGTLVAEAGLRAGDVLVAVDRRPVRTLAEARILIQRAGAHGAVLTLVRHGERIERPLGG